jgi:hypothetical protein
VERSEGSRGSVVDGREYADHPGVFNYGNGVAEVRVVHNLREISCVGNCSGDARIAIA